MRDWVRHGKILDRHTSPAMRIQSKQIGTIKWSKYSEFV